MVRMKFNFEDLEVWKLAVEFAKNIYDVTNKFPKDEMYGIISQIRRAAVSISLNIAEGKGRQSKKELIQFLHISRGSLYEVITLLKISQQLHYITDEQCQALLLDCENIQSKIGGFLNYLRGKV